MNQMTIDEFLERVVAIRPGGLLGFNGAASGIIGASSTGTDLTLRLQRAAIDFVGAYKSTTAAKDVEEKSQTLNGLIMTEATVGAIDQSHADELINALHTLIERRN
jgi:hypothetical protein